MSLGRASFFVPGERSLFHASLLIGKRSLLNIIKVSRKWKFCDHPDDKGPVTLYRLRTCIRGPRNGWSNLLERVIEERENKKNKQLVLSVKATSWNSGGKVPVGEIGRKKSSRTMTVSVQYQSYKSDFQTYQFRKWKDIKTEYWHIFQ